jgi:hypothetical protein
VSKRLRYSESEARQAIAASLSYSEALRRLGMRAAGGNHQTLRKYAERIWCIPTDHFDPHAKQRVALASRVQRPLLEYLTERSPYSRQSLKRRLLKEGLKSRACELCGQGEVWRGRRMSLVLDHINGVADDNRLENLRILCPNCAATLDTHCGRNKPRVCPSCDALFHPSGRRQRYCSHKCWCRSTELAAINARQRRVKRPTYEQLLADLRELSWVAVGAKYGVSDNAVRKWLQRYQAERFAA